jgi:hypothetical protein
MDKLTYEVLNEIVHASEGAEAIEVVNVDIKRLRDDKSDIQPGDEVAFVATGSFRLADPNTTVLDRLMGHGLDIAVGDELFAIGPDAELRSKKLPLDEDSVALWLAQNYKFTFLLNGDEGAFGPLGPVRITTPSPASHDAVLVLPWLQKLNTAAVKDDYVDVDIRIDSVAPAALPPPPPAPIALGLPTITTSVISADRGFNVSLAVTAEITATSAAQLAQLVGATMQLPLKTQHPDGDIVLVFTVNDVTPKQLAAPPPSAAIRTSAGAAATDHPSKQLP